MQSAECQCNACDLTMVCAYDAEGGRKGLFHGVEKMWLQVTAQSVALKHMLEVLNLPSRYVPVFGGDLRHHLILHVAQDDTEVLHNALSASDSDDHEEQRGAQACMRGMVQAELDMLAASGD